MNNLNDKITLLLVILILFLLSAVSDLRRDMKWMQYSVSVLEQRAR